MQLFVFDIETIPDAAAGRKLMNLDGYSDEDVISAMLAKRRDEANGSEFLQHYLHKVVAISVALKTPDSFKVWSLGSEASSEKDIIERFYKGIDKFVPTLVTWNGTGFDLPVLHYRALIQGVQAPRYWDAGEKDAQFKWNNYLNRYHSRHIDLMDVLSGYQTRAVASLDSIATLLGFPGKFGMDGSKVLESYQQGQIKSIRDYCETDVLNTYLVYCRYELMKGAVTPNQYEANLQQVKAYLESEQKDHFSAFLDVWNKQEMLERL